MGEESGYGVSENPVNVILFHLVKYELCIIQTVRDKGISIAELVCAKQGKSCSYTLILI